MDIRAHQALAFNFLARLGPVVWPHLGNAPDQPQHIGRVFDATWIEGFSLPLANRKAAEQTVTLVDRSGFHRGPEEKKIARDYRESKRTCLYESLNTRSDGWFSLVTLDLARVTRRQVICTAYESRAGDSNLGAHDDQWLGLIIQMQGAKRWLTWPGTHEPPTETLTEAGDVLILPKGIVHEVNTPENPGHSTHLLFAITAVPIETTHDLPDT